MSWDREFDAPVPLPRGKRAVTLREAALHITKLPKAEAAKDHWQTAMEVLMAAAEQRGPMMHARIGMMQALSGGGRQPPEVQPGAKDTHWGRRPLARDR